MTSESRNLKNVGFEGIESVVNIWGGGGGFSFSAAHLMVLTPYIVVLRDERTLSIITKNVLYQKKSVLYI